jgi:mRNA (2'-O-methyladenosine-N6-)-methyltransferase
MADPPWDIRMSLPYGTMPDDEMKLLPVQCLQDHGYAILLVNLQTCAYVLVKVLTHGVHIFTGIFSFGSRVEPWSLGEDALQYVCVCVCVVYMPFTTRTCLQLWGYQRVDELVWIKTNQLNRLIRSGRTGHYLNHAKVSYVDVYGRERKRGERCLRRGERCLVRIER